MRFKIRSLMIAVLAVAGLLAALRYPVVLLALLPASWLAWAIGLWRSARPYRRLSAVVFASVGIITNILAVIASIGTAANGMVFVIVNFVACLFGIPWILGCGAAWCTAATRKDAVPRRSRVLAWTLVLTLSLAPLTALLTNWPFRLAFLASQPALDRLADQAASGVPVTTPEWAGAFVIVASAVDPKTGNVGLITDPNPGGRGGFERYGPRGSPGARGAFYNFWSETQLNEKWRFAEED
jgi:hypothetical protein